ncbi:MAG: outer membrane beta-barrel domain-containing protein [Deltaproteobacteria bacterium]|nr:outer membrane beta-barrel domain-containing protein [Deltaproteobacteria bacterium]
MRNSTHRLSRRLALALGSLALALSALPVAHAEEAVDRELAKYWDAEIAVPSLSNPLYERRHGVEGEVHYGIVPNDNFYLFQSVGGRVDFYLTDTVALDADFSYMMAKESKILDFLKHVDTSGGKQTNLTIGSQQPPRLNWMSSVGVAFSPFHGKFGIFDKKLSSFDVNFHLGLGILSAEVDESQGNKPPASAIKVGGAWGIGFRFFLTRFLNIRVDYKQTIYHPQESIAFLAPVEFSAGIGFLSK